MIAVAFHLFFITALTSALNPTNYNTRPMIAKIIESLSMNEEEKTE